MLELLLGNIWPALVAVALLVAGFFGLKSKRDNTKAAEATERAEEAERQVQEAQAVNTAQERAHDAVTAVKAKKPKRNPPADRSSFERTK